MLELCMLFHGLGPSPRKILSTSFMLPSRNPLSLNPLNCGGQPFLHAMWQNTRTGMGRTFVHLSIEMYVMNRLSTASLSLASSGDKLFLSVKVKGRTSIHATHACTDNVQGILLRRRASLVFHHHLQAIHKSFGSWLMLVSHHVSIELCKTVDMILEWDQCMVLQLVVTTEVWIWSNVAAL